MYYTNGVTCPACNSPLLTNSVEEYSQEESTESTPEFEEDLKKFKKLCIEKRKSLTALQPIIKTAYDSFKENIEPLVTQIKELKEQALETINSSDQYKAANSMFKKVTYAQNKLIKKYPTRRSYIGMNYRDFRRRNLSRLLYYKFRIKGI